MSSSEDYSAEGSSDVNDQKVNKTSRKLSSVDGPAILPHHCFPAPVIKTSTTNVANSRAMGGSISPYPGVIVPPHTGGPADLSIKVYPICSCNW